MSKQQLKAWMRGRADARAGKPGISPYVRTDLLDAWCSGYDCARRIARMEGRS